MALAMGTHAYAAAVRYENPTGADHFPWGSFTGLGLDLRVDATSQPGFVAGEPGFNAGYTSYSVGGGAGAYGGAFSSVFGRYGAEFLTQDGQFAAGLGAGQTIGPAGTFSDLAGLSTQYYNTYTSEYTGFQTSVAPGSAYLGVRFFVDTTARGLQAHYGWIGIELDLVNVPENYGFADLRVMAITNTFAWGWETEPGVPIAAGAPAPGTLGALAFGAVPACGRGRRKKTA
jgi:hypothetical protein